MAGSTTGEVTVEGVQFASNTLTADQMRESLGVTKTAEGEEVQAEPVVEPEPKAAEPAKPEQAKKKLDPTKDPETRISKATFEREEARRERDAERQRREQVEREYQDFRAKHEKPVVETKPVADGDPTFEQLLEKHKDAADPYAAAIREQARNDYRAEAAAEKARDAEAKQKAYQEQTQKERETTEQTRIAAFGSRMASALAANPELQTRMETAGPDFYMTKAMGDGFIESEAPERLIAYLLDHHDEHQAILAMASGLQQFRAIARIDAKLETPATSENSGHPAKSKSAANPPITPVGGGHAAPQTGEPDPHTSTQEEFEAYWNAREKADKLAGARR